MTTTMTMPMTRQRRCTKSNDDREIPSQASNLIPIPYRYWYLCAVIQPCDQGAADVPPYYTTGHRQRSLDTFILYDEDVDTNPCHHLIYSRFYIWIGILPTGHRPWQYLAIFNLYDEDTDRKIRGTIYYIPPDPVSGLVFPPLATGRGNPSQFFIYTTRIRIKRFTLFPI